LAKPFSIQAPEDVAKEYGGNKQAIAQAAQMGIVDPTAAVLAGMFIDRMRSAQVMEGGQQPTVAQKVLGGGGLPTPPTNPMAPGMGAPAPQPAPPMQAPMGAPMEAPPAPMPGMAMGGVASLPIPGAMFDEPNNGGYGDGYAGGGLVAFAGGGKGGISDLYDDVEYWESGGNQNAVSSAGARGVMQLMPGTMRDPGFGITPMKNDSEAENRRVGQQYLDAMYRKYGDRKLALMAYNWGPGNVDEWIKKGAPANKVPKETRDYVSRVTGGKAKPPTPERDLSTAEGRGASIEDAGVLASRLLARPPEYEAAREKARGRFEEMGSDEYYEEERKSAMWQTLAEIGFNMASSKSPYVLQAIGEAAAAAMPGARADKKERKQLKDRALAGIMELGAEDMRQAKDILALQTDIYKMGANQEQFERELALKERISTEELNLAKQELYAKITAARNAGMDVDQAVFAMYNSGDPAKKLAAENWVRLNKSGSGTSNQKSLEDIRAGAGAKKEPNVLDFSSLQ
jgi:hypothetical protein